MQTQFLENELPIPDLEKLGLIQDGKLTLKRDDLDALLSGRRTELVSMNNLQSDGFRIARLEAKLSLDRSEKGEVMVQLHPIYKEAQKHPFLLPDEADQLQKGKITHIKKTDSSSESKRSVVVEYDPDTKEFISYDPEKIIAPEKVNGHQLSAIQKELFKNGQAVQLPDGTTFQHRASEPKGILSDRAALIFSVLTDGGLSYLLIRGLRNILNNPHEQRDEFSDAYNQVRQEMIKQRNEDLSSEQLSQHRDRGTTR